MANEGLHLVTGATGFIGSHVVDHLLARGARVAACVRPTSNLRWLLGKAVERRTLELEREEGLREAVEDVEVLVHVAGVTRSAGAEAFQKGNCEATLRLARTAQEHAPNLKRFVYVSSLAAAGPAVPGRPVTEEDEPHPVSAYGESKRDAESGLKALGSLPLVIVRPPLVYGPRDTNFLSLFKIASRRLLPVVGQGVQRLSFIFADDLAEGILAACESAKGPGRTFFLTGASADWREAGAALHEALGVRTVRISLPECLVKAVGEVFEWRARMTGVPSVINRRKVREMLEPAWTCSGELAERDLGFRAKTSLGEGFRKTAEWYRRAGWL
ncbi:MAG: NAD-dependent epimerase/dehydratase family protein [Planctomycetota bacterium]|jgi:nucleoside-diphosphate-sugar epimerase